MLKSPAMPCPQGSPRMKSSTARVEGIGLLEVAEVTGVFDHLLASARDKPDELGSKRRGRHLVFRAAQDERRNSDRFRAVALVGEPDGLAADQIGGRIDAPHRFDDLASQRRIDRLREQDVDPALRHLTEGGVSSAARDRSTIAWPSG